MVNVPTSFVSSFSASDKDAIVGVFVGFVTGVIDMLWSFVDMVIALVSPDSVGFLAVIAVGSLFA